MGENSAKQNGEGAQADGSRNNNNDVEDLRGDDEE